MPDGLQLQARDVIAEPSPTLLYSGGPSLPEPTTDFANPLYTPIPNTPASEGIHAGAIITVILTLFIFFGALTCACRTSVSLSKLLRRQDGHPEEAEGPKGGARKLRKMLVIGLLISDSLISLSCFWSSVVVLSHKSLEDKDECDTPGFMLASALWWQYGFSLTIAVTTYVALRHPLSLAKDFAERGATPIVAFIIVIGTAQAIVWKALEGFHGWRDTCFYAPPSSKHAELIQFLPRLFTSVLITTIYIPLIHFLRRPDMSTLYLSPKQPRASTPGPSAKKLTSGEVEDLPPWEKLSFPNFHLLEEKSASAVLGPGLGSLGFGAPFLPSSTGGFRTRSRPNTPRGSDRGNRRMTLSVSVGDSKINLGSGSGFGSGSTDRNVQAGYRYSDGRKWSKGRPSTAPAPRTVGGENRSRAEMDQPSLSVGSPGLPLPAPLPTIRIPFSRWGSPEAGSGERGRQDPGPRKAPFDSHESHEREENASNRSANSQAPSVTPTLCSATTACGTSNEATKPAPGRDDSKLQVSLLRPSLSMGSQASSRDCASFRGMLGVPAPALGLGSDTGDDGETVVGGIEELGPGGGGASGEGGGGGDRKVKSMASLMNKSASSFLLWFPLTHFVICILTIARFASYAMTGIDGPALEALTLIVVIGQSAADVIIFGIIERSYRTRRRYRNQAHQCGANPPDSMTIRVA